MSLFGRVLGCIVACASALASGCAGSSTVAIPAARATPMPVASVVPATGTIVLTNDAGQPIPATLPATGGFGGTFTLAAAPGGYPANATALATLTDAPPPNAPLPSTGVALVYLGLQPAVGLTLPSFPTIAFTLPASAQALARRRAAAATSADTLDFFDPANANGGYSVAGTCTADAAGESCTGAPAGRVLFAGTTYTFALVAPPTPAPPTGITLSPASVQFNVPGASETIVASEPGVTHFTATTSDAAIVSIAPAAGSTSSFVLTAGYTSGYAVITVSDANGASAQAQAVLTLVIGNIS